MKANIKISISDIRTTSQVRGSLGDLRALVASLASQKLVQPVVLFSDGRTLLSGYRRVAACKRAGITRISAFVANDLRCATEIMQEQLKSSDSATEIPMSLRERVDLAAVLYGVPRPDGESSRSFPFDKHTAPAVGLSSSTLWRVRSVIHKSQEEAISSDADIDRARKILRLMVEAYECPPSGWKSYSAIEYLHSLLQVGDIPDRLDQLDKPKGTGGDAVKDLPAREETRSPESIPGPRRQLVDIRRGIDSIAGVCAGLAAVSELCPLTAAERAQLGADIRRSKKVLSRIQSML